MIAERWLPLLFGRYPFEDQWRPAIAVALLSAATLLSAWPRRWRGWLLPLWTVPALTNRVVGTLKDTSRVAVVGLFELTGALSLALGGDPVWRPFYPKG